MHTQNVHRFHHEIKEKPSHRSSITFTPNSCKQSTVYFLPILISPHQITLAVLRIVSIPAKIPRIFSNQFHQTAINILYFFPIVYFHSPLSNIVPVEQVNYSFKRQAKDRGKTPIKNARKKKDRAKLRFISRGRQNTELICKICRALGDDTNR